MRVRGLVPPQVLGRTKQPQRAADGVGLQGDATAPRADWVDRLLDPKRLAVMRVDKFESAWATGIRDNLSRVGVLSTELVVDRFTT